MLWFPLYANISLLQNRALFAINSPCLVQIIVHCIMHCGKFLRCDWTVSAHKNTRQTKKFPTCFHPFEALFLPPPPPFQQEMRVFMKTMFRIVKWALSSMPSMPWLTASMICTRSCAQDSRGSARPWTLSMAASCWTTCWKRPSEESRERRFILMKTETPREGKKTRRVVRRKWRCGNDLWIFSRLALSHSLVRMCTHTHTHTHTCVHQSWSQKDVISLDWNRFRGLSAVATTFISLQSRRQHLTVRKHSRVIPPSTRGQVAHILVQCRNEATVCAGMSSWCHTNRVVSCLSDSR